MAREQRWPGMELHCPGSPQHPKGVSGFHQFHPWLSRSPEKCQKQLLSLGFKEKSMGNQWIHHFQDDLVPDSAQTSLPKRATMTIETGRLIWPTVHPRRNPSQVANVDRSGSNTQVPGMSATNSLGTSSEPRGCSAEIETTAVTADSRSNLITWLHGNSQLPNTSRGDWGRFGGVQAS